MRLSQPAGCGVSVRQNFLTPLCEPYNVQQYERKGARCGLFTKPLQENIKSFTNMACCHGVNDDKPAQSIMTVQCATCYELRQLRTK